MSLTHEALLQFVSATGDLRYRQLATGKQSDCALACAQHAQSHPGSHYLVQPLEDTEPTNTQHFYPPVF